MLLIPNIHPSHRHTPTSSPSRVGNNDMEQKKTYLTDPNPQRSEEKTKPILFLSVIPPLHASPKNALEGYLLLIKFELGFKGLCFPNCHRNRKRGTDRIRFYAFLFVQGHFEARFMSCRKSIF